MNARGNSSPVLPIVIVVLLAVVIGAVVMKRGPTGVPDGNGEITIAVAGPMTGSSAAHGDMIRKGAQLAMEHVNADGGVGGRRIRLQVEDDKGDATEATNVARKVANDSNIPIVIGHFNSVCTNSAKEEYNDVGVVSLSPGSTNVAVCAGYPWTFRNLYRDDYQGLCLAQYMKRNLGVESVAVFFENDDYGRGLMQFFVEAAEAEGLDVLDTIQYQRERTQDFKALVSPVVARDPDAIFVSGLYNEGALICKVARMDLGMEDVVFVGGDGLVSPEFIETAGPSAEGVYLSTPFYYDPENADDRAQAFVESFREKYGGDPDTWAALTYDAVRMAAVALDEVGTDREAIRDWFAGITMPEKGYVGVTGNTYFDEEGDCPKPLHFLRVVDGSFRFAEQQLQ